MPVTAVIKHQVEDYDAWREVYDAFVPEQKALGVTHESVHRASDDPNDVLVIHGFGTRGDAESFFSSAELRDAMQSAGVAGPPRIEIYEDA